MSNDENKENNKKLYGRTCYVIMTSVTTFSVPGPRHARIVACQ